MPERLTPENAFQKIEIILVPESTDGIEVIPLENSAKNRQNLGFDVKFYIAGFQIHGESEEMITVTPKHAPTSFLKRVFEMNYFDISNEPETKNIDDWVHAMNMADEDGGPLFCLSIGNFREDGTEGTYLHIRRGYSPSTAFYYINRLVGDKLGFNFEF